MKDREAVAETVKDPLIDFVGMEFDLAGDLCSLVDTALNALKKVTLTTCYMLQYVFSNFGVVFEKKRVLLFRHW